MKSNLDKDCLKSKGVPIAWVRKNVRKLVVGDVVRNIHHDSIFTLDKYNVESFNTTCNTSGEDGDSNYELISEI